MVQAGWNTGNADHLARVLFRVVQQAVLVQRRPVEIAEVKCFDAECARNSYTLVERAEWQGPSGK